MRIYTDMSPHAIICVSPLASLETLFEKRHMHAHQLTFASARRMQSLEDLLMYLQACICFHAISCLLGVQGNRWNRPYRTWPRIEISCNTIFHYLLLTRLVIRLCSCVRASNTVIASYSPHPSTSDPPTMMTKTHFGILEGLQLCKHAWISCICAYSNPPSGNALGRWARHSQWKPLISKSLLSSMLGSLEETVPWKANEHYSASLASKDDGNIAPLSNVLETKHKFIVAEHLLMQ